MENVLGQPSGSGFHDGARERANGANCSSWSKACTRVSDRTKVLNPLTIRDVSLSPRHMLHILRIDQKYFESCCFQDLVKRDRVDAGRFHRDCTHAGLLQPFGCREQISCENRKTPKTRAVSRSAATATKISSAARPIVHMKRAIQTFDATAPINPP